MNQEKIGELLKTLRKKNGKTQEEVARDLYVSQKTISRWESGESLPDISIICDVASYYGITVDELLNGTVNCKDNVIKNSYKEKTSLLSQQLFKNLHIYLIVSLSIFSICILISTLLLFTISNEYVSLFLLLFGMVTSLIIYIVGYKDSINKINDTMFSDNIYLKQNIRKKLVFFLDIFIPLVTLTLFIIYYMLYYNLVEVNYLYTNVSSAFLIIILFTSYYLFRKLILDIKFNKDKFCNRLSILFLLTILIPVIFFIQIKVITTSSSNDLEIVAENNTLAIFLITAYPNYINIISIILFVGFLITSIVLIYFKKNILSMLSSLLLMMSPIISAIAVSNLEKEIIVYTFFDYEVSIISLILAFSTFVTYIIIKFKTKRIDTESL